MSTNFALTNNPLIKLTIGAMPDRMKKLVYLSSLAAVVNNTTNLDKQIVDKLNQVLKLANTGVSSLRLPIHLSGVIWSNKKIVLEQINMLKKSQNNTCDLANIKSILLHTPDWIKYDTPNVMIQDISLVFCDELVKQ